MMEPTPRPGDQRGHGRVQFKSAVEVRFNDFGEFVTHFTRNISLGGLFIETPIPRPVGTLVDFRFSLPDGLNLIEGTGRVVWVRENQDEDEPETHQSMGLRFVSLDPSSRRLIEALVSQRLARLQDSPAPPEKRVHDPWRTRAFSSGELIPAELLPGALKSQE